MESELKHLEDEGTLEWAAPIVSVLKMISEACIFVVTLVNPVSKLDSYPIPGTDLGMLEGGSFAHEACEIFGDHAHFS